MAMMEPSISFLIFYAFVGLWAYACKRTIRWARLQDLRAERKRRNHVDLRA